MFLTYLFLHNITKGIYEKVEKELQVLIVLPWQYRSKFHGSVKFKICWQKARAICHEQSVIAGNKMKQAYCLKLLHMSDVHLS